jgi:hypothetical protein
MKRTILAGIIVLILSGVAWFAFSDSLFSQIPEDWETYTNSTQGFSLRHDPTLTITDDGQNGVRLYKWGPTQKGETELYDGILLSIRKVATPQGAQAYLADQIQQMTQHGTITAPLQEGRLNGLPAQRMSFSGLGDYTFVFVPVEDKSLIEIAFIVPDPTMVGFRKMVDLMLSTFELIR